MTLFLKCMILTAAAVRQSAVVSAECVLLPVRWQSRLQGRVCCAVITTACPPSSLSLQWLWVVHGAQACMLNRHRSKDDAAATGFNDDARGRGRDRWTDNQQQQQQSARCDACHLGRCNLSHRRLYRLVVFMLAVTVAGAGRTPSLRTERLRRARLLVEAVALKHTPSSS